MVKKASLFKAPDSLVGLPIEMLVSIFIYLDEQSLGIVSKVCKVFSEIIPSVLLKSIIDTNNKLNNHLLALEILKKFLNTYGQHLTETDRTLLSMEAKRLLSHLTNRNNNTAYNCIYNSMSVRQKIALTHTNSALSWIKLKIECFSKKQVLAKKIAEEQKEHSSLIEFWECYLQKNTSTPNNKKTLLLKPT